MYLCCGSRDARTLIVYVIIILKCVDAQGKLLINDQDDVVAEKIDLLFEKRCLSLINALPSFFKCSYLLESLFVKQHWAPSTESFLRMCVEPHLKIGK